MINENLLFLFVYFVIGQTFALTLKVLKHGFMGRSKYEVERVPPEVRLLDRIVPFYLGSLVWSFGFTAMDILLEVKGLSHWFMVQALIIPLGVYLITLAYLFLRYAAQLRKVSLNELWFILTDSGYTEMNWETAVIETHYSRFFWWSKIQAVFVVLGSMLIGFASYIFLFGLHVFITGGMIFLSVSYIFVSGRFLNAYLTEAMSRPWFEPLV